MYTICMNIIHMLLTSNENDLAVVGSGINSTKVGIVDCYGLGDISKPAVHTTQAT